ncbi:M20 family metallopeptidase [Mycolicibacterium komossense]|uniref:M20/M25/M40 family metallo-hydrolase n=1 Tax=Mycolicibacterium komossense TaxID=1779 RepID=A0ABT3C753_9MYCO|nr:M20/M25/M40 family metallo-hydrolase [Mycolicibacterium komossense]MCV7225255.1 M20/M25/M40 family metallo-hydrolase [Mycolicibacterium komossense]
MSTPSQTTCVDPAGFAHSVAELVRIPSVNPLHGGPIAAAHGPIGEGALALRLAQRLRGCGAAEVISDDVFEGRPNVYGYFPGHTDRVVAIDVHTDTVSVEHMTDPPFDGRIEAGSVWGRGALDNKATLGVLLSLLESWHRQGLRPHPSLLVVGTVSEEAGGLAGATRFRRWVTERDIRIHQLLVAEPTDFHPVHGLRGLVLLSITTFGKSAHAATPHLGRNAIETMAPVIAAFTAEQQRLHTLGPMTALGAGCVSVTQVTGGTGSNVVPDRCSITVGRRLVVDENPHSVVAQLSAIARQACRGECEVVSLLPPNDEGTPGTRAFYQDPSSELVRFLAAACGTTPNVAPFGANALRYNGLADEIALFGPGSIAEAHQATEKIAVDDLIRLGSVLQTWLSPS